ncbi:MAG: hypothetical protein ABRQ38_01515, partial [Candidatus Eremiobacterota bacterium]
MEQIIIKPYHIFNHDGRKYIINIEEMSAAGIDDDTAGIIEKCASELDAVTEPPEELAKLGLLQKDTGKTPKVKKN